MEHSSPTSWLLKIPGLPVDEHTIHINGAILVFCAITALSLLAYLKLKKSPESYVIPSSKPTLVNLVDIVVEALYGMVEGTLGKDTEKYFPFIASLFIFVLFSNLLGLLPFSAAPTSSVNTTFALGIAAFVYFTLAGVKSHGLGGYLKHFLMGLGPAGIFVALLEMFSHVIRPFSLGVRLFVNMFVDHAMVGSFQSMLEWLLPVPLLLFGIVVSTIQAFVFATLTAVYVQMSTEHDH